MRTTRLLAVAVLALVALAAPATASTTDASTVTGVAFLDLDGDGTRGADEPGRAGVRTTLRTSATIVDAVVTDVDGAFTFNRVQAGDYTLVVDAPIDHQVTGGTVDGLDTDSGEADVTVGGGDVDLGVVGLGSTVTSGADVAATVATDGDGTGAEFTWRVAAHNLGPDDGDGPVDVRIVLSTGHAVRSVTGDGWTCDESSAIVLCETDSDLAAGSSLPTITLRTAPDGDVGDTVTVTGTARLEGVFDPAPLNDEDVAALSIGAERAAADLDGDGTGDLTDAGAEVTGILVAAILALVVGGGAVATSRRSNRRP